MSHAIATPASSQGAITTLLLGAATRGLGYAIDGHVADACATASSAVRQARDDVAWQRTHADVATVQERVRTKETQVDLQCAELAAMRGRWEVHDEVAEAADDTDDADTVFELARLDLAQMERLIEIARAHRRKK